MDCACVCCPEETNERLRENEETEIALKFCPVKPAQERKI